NVRSIFMVPFERHALFTGRAAELDRLHTILWPTNNADIYWAALVGLGGIGYVLSSIFRRQNSYFAARKTQIAIEFAYRCQERYSELSIFWVTASSRAQFERDYYHIARRAQLPGWNDLNSNVLKLVSDWLESHESGHWLMFLDNADDSDTFFSP